MLNTLKVLIVLTSQASMGPNGDPTGVWFEELATPYYVLQDAGVQVDVVSVGGGKVPVDPRSLKTKGGNPTSVERFTADPAAMAKIEHSAKLDDTDPQAYAAVFLPGGHGTMWDLPQSQKLADLLSRAWQSGKVVAAVCHGPAGLVNAKDAAGKPIVAGRRVSAFSNAEEAGAENTVPFLLESRLKELGAKYESGAKFRPFAVRDGKLITGQNPQSSEAVVKLILQAISEQ